MKKILSLFFILFFLFFGSMPSAEAVDFSSLLRKPVRSFPAIPCNQLKGQYAKMKISLGCNGSEPVPAQNYLTVGMLSNNNRRGALADSFRGLLTKTGKNPTLGQTSQFFSRFTPKDIPWPAGMMDRKVKDLPLLAGQGEAQNSYAESTLREALANPRFANTPITIPDGAAATMANALPDGNLLGMNFNEFTGISNIPVGDMQGFGVPDMSLDDMGFTTLPGLPVIKLDVALGKPPAGSTENNILKNVVTGGYGSGGALIPDTVSCAGRNCPHFEDVSGKRAMEGSFMVPDGFGTACSIFPCKGPSGLNSSGLNPQWQLRDISQKQEKAKLTISFRACSWFPTATCTAAIFPTPYGVAFTEVGLGQELPYFVGASRRTATANDGGGTGTGQTPSGTGYATNRVATDRPVTRGGAATQIRVENNGGYAKMGVERVACQRDGGSGYCLKINDLSKLKTYLSGMGVELARDFKQGDLMKEFSTNYVITDREKYLAYVQKFDVQNFAGSGSGRASGGNGEQPIGRIACATQCVGAVGAVTGQDRGPTAIPVTADVNNMLHPLKGIGNSRNSFTGGRFGDCRDGCSRRHEGLDLQTKRNDCKDNDCTTGAVIISPLAGTVEVAKTGNVTVRHSTGFKTRHIHIVRVQVSQGATIKRGDILGYEGGAGVHTGGHEHLETRRGSGGGDPINPLHYSWEPSIGY